MATIWRLPKVNLTGRICDRVKQPEVFEMQILTADSRSVPSRAGALLALFVTLAIVVVATIFAAGQLGHQSSAGGGATLTGVQSQSAGSQLAAQGASERGQAATGLDESSTWANDQDLLGPI